MVCNLVDADMLIILSHIEGLYTADPRLQPEATLIPVVEKIDARVEAMASSATHVTGRGGAASKIRAAKIAGINGIHTYIANGAHPDAVLRILAGEQVGTHIYPPASTRLSSRKRWIGYALKARGEIVVNDGAKIALTAHGKSLLPAGIVKVSGDFRFGDPVVCVDLAAYHFAQGLVNYSAAELQAISGQQTSHIETLLGYNAADEVIHRDNLVVFSSTDQAALCGDSMAVTLAEKTQLCALAADSRKAEDIVVLDVEQLSSVADYFLICSGTSDRQVRAIADAIAEELAQHGEKPLAMEGYQKGTWVLIDCADLIVHVFDDDTRRFYGLERLWHRAPRVEVPGLAFAMPQSAA